MDRATDGCAGALAAALAPLGLPTELHDTLLQHSDALAQLEDPRALHAELKAMGVSKMGQRHKVVSALQEMAAAPAAAAESDDFWETISAQSLAATGMGSLDPFPSVEPAAPQPADGPELERTASPLDGAASEHHNT